MLLSIVIVAFVVTFCLLSRSWRRDFGRNLDPSDFAMISAMSLFVTFLVGVVSVLIILIPYQLQVGNIDLRQNLQSMSDNGQINGRFSLFGGYINETPVYYYYQQDSDGSFALRYIEVSNAKVFETTGSPYVIKHCEDPTKTSDFWYWPIHMYDKQRPYTCDTADFYIPKGSITNSFNLDGEMR